MKAILIICDGLGDRPVSTLNGKTPLQAARRQALDTLAQGGINGLMYTISPGRPPGSDTGHLALFGYDPHAVYAGRGAFEAIGAGLNIQPGDVAFRCNFATVDDNWRVTDRRAGRISTADARQLADSLKGGKLATHPHVQILFEHSTEHRGALIMRGDGLSPEVSDSDPEEEGAAVHKVAPLKETDSARLTAEILNEVTRLSHEVLRNHPLNRRRIEKGLKPANILLARGAGRLPSIESLRNTYHLNAACVVANALVRGVAISVGMTPINVQGATGAVDSDLMAKAHAAVDSLHEYDFVFLHVKGADNASHDGNVKQKIMMAEKIDAMVGWLMDHVDKSSTCIAITADHATPVDVKNHTGDPVPLTVAGPGIIPDDVTAFTERDCARGGLGHIRGIDLMPIIMNLIGRVKKFGA